MPLAPKAPAALADKVVQAARAVAGNDLGAEPAEVEVEERSSVAAVVHSEVVQVAGPAAAANSVAAAVAADVFFASK